MIPPATVNPSGRGYGYVSKATQQPIPLLRGEADQFNSHWDRIGELDKCELDLDPRLDFESHYWGDSVLIQQHRGETVEGGQRVRQITCCRQSLDGDGNVELDVTQKTLREKDGVVQEFEYLRADAEGVIHTLVNDPRPTQSAWPEPVPDGGAAQRVLFQEFQQTWKPEHFRHLA